MRQPARIERRGRSLLGFVVIALLVLLALFMGQAAQTAAEPTVYRTIAGVLLGAALILLIVRVARRR